MKTALNLWTVANVIGVSLALDASRLALNVARGTTDALQDVVDGFEETWRPRAHAALAAW